MEIIASRGLIYSDIYRCAQDAILQAIGVIKCNTTAKASVLGITQK